MDIRFTDYMKFEASKVQSMTIDDLYHLNNEFLETKFQLNKLKLFVENNEILDTALLYINNIFDLQDLLVDTIACIADNKNKFKENSFDVNLTLINKYNKDKKNLLISKILPIEENLLSKLRSYIKNS